MSLCIIVPLTLSLIDDIICAPGAFEMLHVRISIQAAAEIPCLSRPLVVRQPWTAALLGAFFVRRSPAPQM
jgi:hypothetical protein